MQGGGVPDGWVVENHEVVIGEGAKNSPGSIGLNHRWHQSPGNLAGGRSLYLIDPAGAIVEQELQGEMADDMTYVLRFGYYRYANSPATITAELKTGDRVLASETFHGADFPFREWQTRELSFESSMREEGLPLKVSFEVTGSGDIRLDGVRIKTITPELVVLNEKFEKLSTEVERLPENNERERQKKAVLELDLERAKQAGQAFLQEEYEILLDEIDTALDQRIYPRSEPELSDTLLMPLKTPENNPYLDAIYEWVEEQMGKPDKYFQKSTPDFKPFDRTMSRKEAANMNLYYWLLTHPQSQYQGDPELLKRLFRRIHAYVDAHSTHGHQYQSVTNDFFAIGPMVEAMYKTKETFPDLLLPEDEAKWDQMAEQVRSFWLDEFGKRQEGHFRMGRYANRDLGVANILLSSGLYLDDQESLDTAQFLVYAQRENLYPDGGFSYIGGQNESAGYHVADTKFLTDYYHLTGDESVLDLLKGTEWYAALTTEPGNVSDIWTHPSWKQDWIGKGYGGESVVALTENPYERSILDREIALDGASLYPRDAMWYDSTVVAENPPNDYSIYDRNIQGPRGRFDRFSYAATLREPSDTEPGKATIMGAMTIREDFETTDFPLEAMWWHVMPRAFVETTPEDRHKRPNWVYLTTDDESSVSMGKDWSAVQTRYQMHAYGSSRKGPKAPWEGLQIWIAIRDRVFGLVEIAPDGKQDAFEVGLSAKIRHYVPYEELSLNAWSFGSLEIEILENNFNSVRTVESESFNAPQLEIIYSTRPSDEPISERGKTNASNSELLQFEPADPYYAILEVAVGSSDIGANVSRFVGKSLTGLTVCLGEECYTLIVNTGSEPVELSLSSLGEDASLHYPWGGEKVPVLVDGMDSISIPAGQHRVVLRGVSEDRATEAGWAHFQEMSVHR